MSELLAECTSLLQREALLLDTQHWDNWLELFTDDCEYWVPSWKGEHQTTENPRSELSLIYYKNRAGLADRVWRVRHGRSVASAVLPRTHRRLAAGILARHHLGPEGAERDCAEPRLSPCHQPVGRARNPGRNSVSFRVSRMASADEGRRVARCRR